MSRLNFSPITVIKVMISGIAFDHSNYLSCLRAFLYDHFKFYMIIPIVQITIYKNLIQCPSD